MKDRTTTLLSVIDMYHRHIDGVVEAARLLANELIKLENEEDEKLALLLLRKHRTHDVSKLRGIEFPGIHQSEDKDLLFTAVQHHQQINEHHHQYWPGGIDDMPPVAIAEMVCDWWARSKEKGSGLRDWIKAWFKLNDIPVTGKAWKRVKKYVDLILEPPFEDIRTLKKEKDS